MKEFSRHTVIASAALVPVAAPATPYHHSAFGSDAGHDH